jgi:cyclase
MAAVRIMARLDIKAPNLVKGVHLEGLRIMGDPAEFARRYYAEGADEIIYMDIVASLYGRNNILELVEQTARDVFIPITVGGGIRTIDDVKAVLRAGADKVSVNTAATKDPDFIRRISETFGSQCIVVTIEPIKGKDGMWRAFTDNGRERTGLEVIEWAERVQELGAGEIMLTSVDREGTFRGFDIELIRTVAERIRIPLIAHGGAGKAEDAAAAVNEGGADAVAIAGLFHYGLVSVAEAKTASATAGLEVRG